MSDTINPYAQPMMITIDPKFNFHNSRPLRMRPQSEGRNGNAEQAYFFSQRQAQKISKHFCGNTECRCNSGGLIQENEDETLWSIRKTDCQQ